MEKIQEQTLMQYTQMKKLCQKIQKEVQVYPIQQIEKNRKVLIPIDVNKIEDIKELLGTVTEEVAHGKDTLEGRQDKKVAEDKQLQNAGVKKPDYNCATHHLVSDATMPKATKALNKYGIEINSATNGVYLPTSKADTSKVTTEVVHSKPNGKEYKELLEKSIPDIAENMENTNASYDEIQAALENELNNTRIKLLTGELKINNAKFKTTEKGEKQNENI